MEKNKFYQKENGKGISYILMILMSLLCVVIAGLLLFVPAIEVSTVCYTFCTGFILWGDFAYFKILSKSCLSKKK